MIAPQIGLSTEERKGVIDILNRLLSDTYLLLIKIKKYHWDVVGPQFRALHKLWEEHYEALTENIDAYAERARMLGGYPVGTAREFIELASIQEHVEAVPNASQMIGSLLIDHEQIIRNLREAIDQCTDSYHDEGTADFLISLMKSHEEMAWMLRAFINGEAVTQQAYP